MYALRGRGRLPEEGRGFSVLSLASAMSELTALASPDLLLRGALWNTAVSHLSQRSLGSHDGMPHPHERLRTVLGVKPSLSQLR